MIDKISDKGIEELYIAIFKQALHDDLITETNKFITKSTYEIDSIKGHTDKRRLKKIYNDNYKTKLVNLIKQRIYNETLSWPEKNRNKEKEYKTNFNNLVNLFVQEYLKG